MKILLVALLCVAAAAGFSEDDVEFALYEDAGFQATIGEKIQDGLKNVLSKILDLIDKHKPLLENLKAKFNSLSEQVWDLLSLSEEKFPDALSDIRNKIRELLQKISKQITDHTEGGIDAVGYEIEYPLSPIQELIERIKEHVHASLERLKDLVAKNTDTISTSLNPQIEKAEQKLTELSPDQGSTMLSNLRDIAGEIRGIIEEAVAKMRLKAEAALNAAREEEELFLQALKRRITGRLYRWLEQIKEKLTLVMSASAEKFKPKVQDIDNNIKALAFSNPSAEELRDKTGQMSLKVTKILAELQDSIILIPGVSLLTADDDERELSLLPRIIKRTQSSLQALHDRVRSLLDKHLKENFNDKMRTIKTAIDDLDQEKGSELRQTALHVASEIRQLVKEIWKSGIGNYHFGKGLADAKALKDFLVSEVLVSALREHAADLDSTNEITNVAKFFIVGLGNQLPEYIKEILKNVHYVSFGEYEDIRVVARRAVAWLQTDDGIHALRQYSQDLPIGENQIARVFREQLARNSDDDLKTLFKEMFTIF